MPTIEQRFIQFDADNPHVYILFKKFSFEAKRAGMQRYSAKTVFERLRWHLDFETKGDTFKLNNNYTAYYARKLINENPEFKGFFELREKCFGYL